MIELLARSSCPKGTSDDCKTLINAIKTLIREKEVIERKISDFLRFSSSKGKERKFTENKAILPPFLSLTPLVSHS